MSVPMRTTTQPSAPEDPYSNPAYGGMMYQEPSMWDKLKMGALMGGMVGGGAGFLFGGFVALRYGPGQNGYLRTIGQYMMNMGGMFAGIMSIGAVLRTEEQHTRSRLSGQRLTMQSSVQEDAGRGI